MGGYFEDCDDFCSVGNVVSLDDRSVWFTKADVYEYGNLIDYSVRIHGGIYFVRKSQTTENVWGLCNDIISKFDKLHFNVFTGQLVDETVAALAMSVCHLKPVKQLPELIDVYPCNTFSDIDISTGKVRYLNPWINSVVNKSFLVHFGHIETEKWFYQNEVFKLNRMIRKKKNYQVLVWLNASFLKCREKIRYFNNKLKRIICG